MQWPQVSEPLTLSNFEASARFKRYRLFAMAALDANIRHLFLGHHQDDQVETIMMRLLRTQTRSFLGLQGIHAQGTIPCCEDIPGATALHHGIHWAEAFSSSSPGDHRTREARDVGNEIESSDGPGSAGIQIHRPLLDCPKSELVATCTSLGIRYVTDTSNFDPRLTMRNAIRHLRSEYRLPQALQASSILRLLSSSRKSMADLKRRGVQCLRTTKIRHFDPHVGFMKVYLEPAFLTTCRDDPEAAAYALARLTAMISPQSRDDAPTLVPEERLREFQAIWSSPNNRGSLTMQQVWLEKLATSSRENEKGSLWQLSRPPLRGSEIMATTATFQPLIKIQHRHYYSQWLLWDRRFWIRVKAETSHDIEKITIRALQETDLEDIKQDLSNTGYSKVVRTLSKAAPGKLRYTIPILLHDGKLSALPTLDLAVHRPAERSSIMGWESYFKEIPQEVLDNDVGEPH